MSCTIIHNTSYTRLWSGVEEHYLGKGSPRKKNIKIYCYLRRAISCTAQKKVPQVKSRSAREKRIVHGDFSFCKFTRRFNIKPARCHARAYPTLDVYLSQFGAWYEDDRRQRRKRSKEDSIIKGNVFYYSSTSVTLPWCVILKSEPTEAVHGAEKFN